MNVLLNVLYITTGCFVTWLLYIWIHVNSGIKDVWQRKKYRMTGPYADPGLGRGENFFEKFLGGICEEK